MSQLPSPLRLATSLDVTTIRDICRPLFDSTNSQTSTFVWAGVFGSISRGTQRDNSDVDIIVGFASNASFFHDVFDVVQHVRNGDMGLVQVEALLAAKTIWGDEQWLSSQRDEAESVLRQSYLNLKEAEKIMKAVRQRVLESKDVLILTEHGSIHHTLTTDALAVIQIIGTLANPFCQSLRLTAAHFIRLKTTFESYLRRNDLDKQVIQGIWDILSDTFVISGISNAIESAEECFSRAGLSPTADLIDGPVLSRPGSSNTSRGCSPEKSETSTYLVEGVSESHAISV